MMDQRALWKGVGVPASLCLLLAALLWIGCAAKEPMDLTEPMEGDDILTAPVVTPESPGSAVSVPVTPAQPTEQAALLQTVQQLESQVARLETETSAVKGQVESLSMRVGTVETALTQANEQAQVRFADFDAALAEIRRDVAANQAALTPPTPVAPARDIEAEVALAVDTWRQAWQAKDLDTYMRGYQPNAQVVRVSVVDGGRLRRKTFAPEQLRASMARLFQQYARMEVLIFEFRVAPDGNRLVATFQQEFTAWARARDTRPIYSDRGMKTLVFNEDGGAWRIAEETWGPMAPAPARR